MTVTTDLSLDPREFRRKLTYLVVSKESKEKIGDMHGIIIITSFFSSNHFFVGTIRSWTITKQDDFQTGSLPSPTKTTTSLKNMH